MARLLYKCRLCGDIDGSVHCRNDMAPEQAFQIMRKGITSLKGTAKYKKTHIHSCNKTDIGITDFVGYRLEEE